MRSSDGRQVDVTDLLDTAEQHGARVLLDITQSCGWLPLDCSRVDYVVCAGYKWLLCPRGAAFLALRPPLLDTIAPTSAGWYAGEDIWSSIYGDAVRAHDVALADRFLTGFGLPPGGSAIATVSIEGAADRLAAAGVRASVRAGRARLSFHLHNEAADVDLALEALNRGTGPSSPGRAASTRSVTDRPPRG